MNAIFQLETPLLNEDEHSCTNERENATLFDDGGMSSVDDELCDNVNRSMQKETNAGDGSHSVCFKDEEIRELIKVSLDDRGYSCSLADSCYKVLKDDLEILLHTATEQAALQACSKLMQKTFEINISYDDGKVCILDYMV